jgi:hypothetical protein
MLKVFEKSGLRLSTKRECFEWAFPKSFRARVAN